MNVKLQLMCISPLLRDDMEILRRFRFQESEQDQVKNSETALL